MASTNGREMSMRLPLDLSIRSTSSLVSSWRRDAGHQLADEAVGVRDGRHPAGETPLVVGPHDALGDPADQHVVPLRVDGLVPDDLADAGVELLDEVGVGVGLGDRHGRVAVTAALAGDVAW